MRFSRSMVFLFLALFPLSTGAVRLSQAGENLLQGPLFSKEVEPLLSHHHSRPWLSLSRIPKIEQKPNEDLSPPNVLPGLSLKDWRETRFRFDGTTLHEYGEGENSRAIPHVLLAQDSPLAIHAGTTPSSERSEMDQLGEAMANPLSYLWLMFMQNDTTWFDGDIADDLGEDDKVQNTFLIQPVLSIQLTERWKTIIRPVIPINSFETVDNVDISTDTAPGVTGVDFDRKTGLGDIVLWTAFSNQYTPPVVWGFGPTVMMNTATDDQLGTGKWSAGPMGIGLFINENWILGTVAQHWWSFAGEDTVKVKTSLGNVRVDRSDVSLTDIQPIVRWRVSPTTNIGMAPNWRYNWETNQLNLPLGIGADMLVKLGPLPAKVGLEAYYYVERDDDFGPKFQFRFLFVPVLPAPEWSRIPIF